MFHSCSISHICTIGFVFLLYIDVFVYSVLEWINVKSITVYLVISIYFVFSYGFITISNFYCCTFIYICIICANCFVIV